MATRFVTRRVGAALVALAGALAAAGVARADVYALSYLDASDQLVVRELPTTAAAVGAIPGCCAVVAGTATVDTAGNVAWFIEPTPGGQVLRALRYVGGGSTAVAISPGYRITHLEWDASQANLVGASIDEATDALTLVRIAPSTGVVTPLGTAIPGCCSLRAGVSALTTAGGPRLLAVGRRTGDAEDQLLAFDLTTVTIASAIGLPASMHLSDLVRHPVNGSVYALAHSTTTGSLALVILGPAPTYTPTPIGEPTAACCFVLAGAAAIDRVANRFVAMTAGGAVGPFEARAFDIATGASTVGPALTANALFEDSAVTVGVLFADGFE